jgi:hypothetical protein
MFDPCVARLCRDGHPVADYVPQPDLPADVAPRPYLHPVRTLGGTEVTELMPADHRHHLGVSVAVPDLAGCNFWGGRTFVRAQGPTPLNNHGRQRHTGWISRSEEAITAGLSWESADGAELLREQRRIATMPVGDTGWALDLTFELTNVTARPLPFASPATNGRPGAGYGGFFWRAPATSRAARALGPAGGRLATLHGRPHRWLALAGPGWTLIFIPADARTGEDPWFVRTRDYPGVGSSLAWDRPLLLAAGGTIRRRIITVVVDGILPAARAEELARNVHEEQRA